MNNLRYYVLVLEVDVCLLVDNLQGLCLGVMIFENKNKILNEYQIFKFWYDDCLFVVDQLFFLNDIELMNYCLMKCVMCFCMYSMIWLFGYMSFEVFLKIIDEYVDVNLKFEGGFVIWFYYFGESFMYFEFDCFMKYVWLKNVFVGFFVNFIVFNEKIVWCFIDSNLYMIILVIDGYDNESFDKIWGVKNVYD